MLEREPEPVEELAVQQAALRVELLVRAGDGELVPDDAGAGDAEHLPEVGLRPHGAELARAGADHGHGLVAQSALAHRARGPVDRVLQHAGNRTVVLGCGEEDRVRRRPLLTETADGRGELLELEILVVQGQVADALPDLDLDALRRGLGRGVQELRVVRRGPQAA